MRDDFNLVSPLSAHCDGDEHVSVIVWAIPVNDCPLCNHSSILRSLGFGPKAHSPARTWRSIGFSGRSARRQAYDLIESGTNLDMEVLWRLFIHISRESESNRWRWMTSPASSYSASTAELWDQPERIMLYSNKSDVEEMTKTRIVQQGISSEISVDMLRVPVCLSYRPSRLEDRSIGWNQWSKDWDKVRFR